MAYESKKFHLIGRVVIGRLWEHKPKNAHLIARAEAAHPRYHISYAVSVDGRVVAMIGRRKAASYWSEARTLFVARAPFRMIGHYRGKSALWKAAFALAKKRAGGR